MPDGDGKLGRPLINIGTIASTGKVFPQGLIRDNFDTAFERRNWKEIRGNPLSLVLPGSGAATSGTTTVVTVVHPNPHYVLLGITLRDLVRRETSAGVQEEEVKIDEVITIEIKSRALGSGSFQTFKTYTLKGNTRGTDGIDEEIPIPFVNSSEIQVVVSRTETVSESGPEIRVQPIFNGKQVRKVRTLVGHIDAATQSTTSTQFSTFSDQDFVTNPPFYVSNVEGAGMVPKSYPGDYEVDRVSVDDQGNGLSRVRVSMTQTDNWEDSET